MQQGLKYLLSNALFALDLIGLNLLIFILLLFYQWSLSAFNFNPYIQLWVMANLIWVIVAVAVRLYGSMLVLKFELFVKRTSQLYVLWVMLMLLYLVVIREVDF